MTNLQQIKTYLDDYLDLPSFTDDSWNGLQYEGSSQIQKIASAVDATSQAFAAAGEAGADMLLVHHGLFWHQSNPSLVGWQKDRLDLLRSQQISLYAAHLPLDQHPVVGNNAQILNLLKAQRTVGFYPHDNNNIGWIGQVKPTALSTITDQLNTGLATACRVLPFGKKQVTTIAVCSGSGGYAGFFAALADHVDLYISGDPVYVDPNAKEARLNVIFAGHYATETLGVITLSEQLSRQYSLPHTFLELPPDP